MACAFLVGTQETKCTEFMDEYGPYPTKQECMVRAYVMREDLMEYLMETTGIPHFFQYKCLEDEINKTAV